MPPQRGLAHPRVGQAAVGEYPISLADFVLAATDALILEIAIEPLDDVAPAVRISAMRSPLDTSSRNCISGIPVEPVWVCVAGLDPRR
jgi:hypothetical protein